MGASRLIKQFQADGYVHIDTELSNAVLDGVRCDLKPYFGKDRQHPVHVPQADAGRIQDAWYISQNALKIAKCPAILSVLRELYKKEPKPFQTLNFPKGTQQAVHADSIHFNSEPFGMMCGVWVALEDIGPDQGPLVYYPGSHKLPEMNYADLNIEFSENSYQQYIVEIQKLIEQHDFQPEYGLIKKGQAIIWSANIFHGGAPQTNPQLSRYSQVTHYYFGNPKCWRPTKSRRKREYFKPDWVRDVSDEAPRYPLPPLKPLSIKRPLEFSVRAWDFTMRRLGLKN